MIKLHHWLSSAAIGALAVAGGVAWADPPERVGRVAFIRGDVSIQPTQQDDWSPATRNYPVTQDEGFWTEQGANAELQIGPIEVFLDGETEFDIDQLDYGVTQFSLPDGAVHIEMARVPDGGVRIETPQGEVRLTAAGAYRIDAGASDDNNPDTLLVTVLSGRAEVAGPGVLVPVERGQMATVDNGYRVSISAGGGNDLDDFAHRQLQAERYNDAPVYVSDDYTGYEDLNAYGDWEDTADYGRVWYPRGVAIDWAPYHYGRWAHVAPWGWTWIDDAQWGFTPFHYGRWTEVRGRWCWAPGERVARPIYAPALVSFIGGGPGVGIGISVGWVPLAPREVYRPYYSVSTAYVRNINITNVDRRVVNTLTVENIRRSQDNVRYHNDHARMFVRQDDFSRAAPVQRAAIKGAPPQAGGRGPQPFDISRVKATPPARAGVAGGDRNGGPPRGHAPRFDKRPIVMKPPAANVVPHTPTAPVVGPANHPGQPSGQPAGRPGFQRGNGDDGRGDRDRGGRPRGDATLRQGGVPAALPQQPPVATEQDRRGPPGRNGRNFGRDNPGGANPAVSKPAAVPSGASSSNLPNNPPNDPRGDRERFRRGPGNATAGQGGSPPPPPHVQPASPPQVQHDERRPGQPAPAVVNERHDSPGDAGGRFGRRGDNNGGDAGDRGRERRGGPPQGGNAAPQPSPPQQPAHVAAPPPQPAQAQPQPPHLQGGVGHRGGGQPQGQPQAQPSQGQPPQGQSQGGHDDHDRRHRGSDQR